jgi:phosphatidylinositol glycan class O
LFEIIDTNKLSDTPAGPIVLGFLGSFHFFKTGHQATLASIQWESAFIPLKTIKYPWSPLLIVLNTFGAQILCAIAVPAVVLWKQPPKKKGLLGDVAKAMATHFLFYAVINLATTMWAGWLRRHLMLYRIFCPRFMAGAIVLLVVEVVGILIALLGTRLSFLSVAEVFGWS